MRINIRSMRRRELIEATRDVISEVGFENATISKISKKAGFSIGYLHHHFANKDELLADTIRVLYSDMHTYLVNRQPSATNPFERYLVLLDANFRAEQYTKENAFAWISFLARVPFNKEFFRLQTMIERRLNSNLMYDVGKILPHARAAEAVEQISTLIDGYWIRLGVNPSSIDSKQALERMWEISDKLFDGLLHKHIKIHDTA